MARLWEIREDFEPEYRHSSPSEEELYKAYKKGYKHGYEKAMEEMEYRTNYRGGMDYRKKDDDEDYAEYRRGGKMGR